MISIMGSSVVVCACVAKTRKTVAHAAHPAIQGAYGATSHTSELTATYIRHKIHHCPRCYHVVCVICWLKAHAFWQGTSYLTSALPEKLSPKGITAAWCTDLPALTHLHAISQPSSCVCSLPLSFWVVDPLVTCEATLSMDLTTVCILYSTIYAPYRCIYAICHTHIH